jgi:hypothetical protein
MKKIALFFHNVATSFANLWAKEPQVEAVINQVITGINVAGGVFSNPVVDIIAHAFPGGIGGKTLDEVKVLIPEALEISTIASDALKASEGVTDPTAKANAVITTTLQEVAKLPELAKESHTLTIISAIVSKILGISLVEATHYVTAKQIELTHTVGDPAAIV